MSIRQLPQTVWRAYFDRFSKEKSDQHRVDYAEIRVFSAELGAQPETRWLPLEGITYDHHDDRLDIFVKGLGHLIAHPQSIHIDETNGRLDSMEIVRTDGAREVVEIR